ncbi:hypothetical protein [Rhodococcus tibetensis]|uniref:Toxin-antitoxin system HicB family antitoxin n=1 Tax=Rhodococcus tibetensis TaxID=2965064 RepID=A0ABT1QHU3_9NOCA|nr:hypothetical protein [Rhodococcus sp. FXJ9.536]MCQ4121811.1 hypothetical protein [Rhodococcus sp. FXJ9.536]
MDLAPYVAALRSQLAVAAEAGGEDALAVAERLVAPLESAVRLAMLDVLSTAASEITRDLAPGSVDLRLRGKEPSFVVTPPPVDASFDEAEAPTVNTSTRRLPEGDDGAMTRINLRLTQDMKDRVEEAARESGLSVNAWLVRSATAALGVGNSPSRPERRAPRGGDSYTGWVR